MTASRRKMLTRGVPLALASTAVAGIVLAMRRVMVRARLPANGRHSLDGLVAPVEIIRDRWGVPHIYARSEPDLFFAQGFVHAQDRLFQMEVNRRVGLGRVSELIGPLGIQMDRFARFMGWPRAAQAQVAGADSVVGDTCAAYNAGVNAFIQSRPLPPEYALLAVRPEPWRLLDTVAWGTVLSWGLSVNWETELQRLLLLQLFGADKTADLDHTLDADSLTWPGVHKEDLGILGRLYQSEVETGLGGGNSGLSGFYLHRENVEF